MGRTESRWHGFSLIELMVTISVLVILLALGVPSFSQLLSSNRASALTNDLQFALKFARGEAIKRGAPVSLCPRAAGNPDTPDPAACSNAAADWRNGWVVINRSGCVDLADCERLLDTPVDASALTVRYGQPLVNFNASGRMLTGIGGTFSICDPGASDSLRRVIIAPSGRSRLEKGGDCP